MKRVTRPAPAGGRAIVLVDTGILVALFDSQDSHHAAAKAWLARTDARLLTVAPVLAEAAFFLPPRLRGALAGLAAQGALQVHQPDEVGYARIAQLFDKYAAQDPDWADLELVWLAETTGSPRIATVSGASGACFGNGNVGRRRQN